jgi:hypothetical protein
MGKLKKRPGKSHDSFAMRKIPLVGNFEKIPMIRKTK